MRYSRLLLGLALSLLLVAGAIPFAPAPFQLRPAFAAIAHVGTDTKQVNQTGSTSYTITLAQQASAGDALVVFISTDNGGIRLPTTVSGGGLTGWTQELSATEGVTGNAGIAIWIGFNASGSGGTSISVTGNIQSGDHWGFMTAEFSGVTSTLDQTASTAVGTANGSIATPTITTTNANDLILADFTVNVSGQTYTGSMTGVDTQPTDMETGQATMGAVYSIVSATGAQSTTWNNSGSPASWTTGIMALQASVVAAATPTGGGPDTFPLLGVGNGGQGGGGGIAAPPGNQVGTRDPALQPFATNSVWNYPIGSSATTSTGPMADGRTWAQEQAAFPNNMYVQVPAFTLTVVIAQASDPTVTFCLNQSASSVMNTLYGTTRFDRHSPSFTLGTGEPELSVIQPDHLTAFEQYDPVSGTACSGLATEYDIGLSFGNAFVNVDLKGPGIFTGNGGSDVGCTGCGDMGIALTSGDASSPANIVSVANGNPISAGGQVSASKSSAIAGLIRKGELANGIPHALRLEAGIAMLNRNAPGSHNFVWPAYSCDGGTCTNYGTSGNLYMGNLVTISGGASTCTGHSFNTVAGKNVCLALANYGGYIVDTACNNCLIILLDFNAESEVPSQNSSSDMQGDNNFNFQNIVTVTNSYHSDGTAVQTGKKIDGGDGTVNNALIAAAFDSKYGGGNGRTSYFVPHIPRAMLARLFPMLRLH